MKMYVRAGAVGIAVTRGIRADWQLLHSLLLSLSQPNFCRCELQKQYVWKN
jgi:hypothetical protein